MKTWNLNGDCVAFLLTLLFSLNLLANPKELTFSQSSENKALNVELTLLDGALKRGNNHLRFLLTKDRKPVLGAKITLVPFMPEMGHGTSKDPTVIEKGKGYYAVDDMDLVMGGHWELRLEIALGKLTEKVRFDLAEEKLGKTTEASGTKFETSIAEYVIPDVTLYNQHRQKMNFKTLLETDESILVSFLFTTCTTICPMQAAIIAGMQRQIASQGKKRIHFVSVSIDPEQDTPERMKKYLQKFNAQDGWEFLTGSKKDIDAVLKGFNAYLPDKMSHRPVAFLKFASSNKWVRISNFTSSDQLLSEYTRVRQP